MNRSLLTFLIFLAALGLGFALVGWWAGPAMLSLAVDDERRGAPYYLIHLLPQGDVAGYFQSFAELLRAEEAQLLWRGGVQALHAGGLRDEAVDVALIEFVEGGGVVQMMTSSGYRELTADGAPVLLGTTVAPAPIARDEALLLWLLDTADGADGAALEPLAESAREFGGQIVWSVPVDALGGERSWDRVLLLAFPAAGALTRWLDAPGTATNRALARRYITDEAMLELNGR